MSRNWSKSISIKDYPLITADEVHARETKYQNILLNLQTCVTILDEAIVMNETFRAQNHILNKWNNYLGCENMPKPYVISEIHTFFEKMRHYELEDKELTIDYLLKVDERSKLTQDMFAKDNTFNNLRANRPELGTQYNKNINMALRVGPPAQFHRHSGHLVYEISEEVSEDELAAIRDTLR